MKLIRENPESDGNPWKLTRLGDLEGLKKFLVNCSQFNINEYDECNCTCLFWACKHGHLEIVKFLLANQADVNLVGYNGMTPLHVALLNIKQNVVHELIKANSDSSLKDVLGNGCFHFVALKGVVGQLEYVSQNINLINEMNLANATPLDCALNENSVILAQRLKEMGAKANLFKVNKEN